VAREADKPPFADPRKAHYDHKALWTLTVAIGQMLFFTPVALIGKPVPGTEARWSK